MRLTKKAQRQVLEVAKRQIYAIQERGDLETRHSDGEDFLDIAVWSLKATLEEAYALGLKEGQHAKE